MSDTYLARLQALGLELPATSTPGGSYDSTVATGALLFVSGQICQTANAESFVGKLGAGISLEEGQQAARLAALNVVAQARKALDGDLDRVVRCVRIGGFINAVPEFRDHSAVMNGASDLMVALFGDRGRHARTSVGVGSLPRGVAVEVEAIFEIRP